jgi:hypothetical protein
VHVEGSVLRERLAGNEEDGRHAELLQDGQRELGLAAEAVVEGDGAGPLGERRVAGRGRDELVTGDELPRAAEEFELRPQAVRRDREDRARLARRLCRDVVVTDGEEYGPMIERAVSDTPRSDCRLSGSG